MTRKNSIFCALAVAFALSGCDQQTVFTSTVHHRGALRNAMQAGDISAKIDLDSLAGKPHLFALGALENLKGEIQIFDSQPFITTVIDSAIATSSSFSYKAMLLVYAQVSQWQENEIPDSVKTGTQLEAFLASEASKKGIFGKPFVFLLKGRPASLDWHVIDWPAGDSVHTHEKHKRSGLHGSLHDEQAEILGFYSEQHHGIFTHHSTNMHLHFTNSAGTFAGHVDALVLKKGIKLYLPGN